MGKWKAEITSRNYKDSKCGEYSAPYKTATSEIFTEKEADIKKENCFKCDMFCDDSNKYEIKIKQVKNGQERTAATFCAVCSSCAEGSGCDIEAGQNPDDCVFDVYGGLC